MNETTTPLSTTPATTAEVPKWHFWIDRGGTFTDVVARRPDGTLVSHKLLSENPEQYSDAAIQGIRDLLQLSPSENIPADQIAVVKMGTTVATNALLERQGEPTLLLITRGFKDALRIGYQHRPKLFDLNIQRPELLYQSVIEIDERLSADGQTLQALDIAQATQALQQSYDKGLRSVAIVLMHGYRYHQHEQRLAELAQDIGFTQISTSHQTSPLMKLVSRGDTTVVDAYLSPILRRYVNQVVSQLQGVPLLFMQSNGGLVDAHFFQGKDSILSGPAGGIVGAAQTSAQAGFNKIIGFDMGGTSTDVTHYAGEYEQAFETQVAGVRMRAPMMQIHTVAAGGGSILNFDGNRLRVGPESAGANPGPACYRRGGPLTVTDCNLMLGKIAPRHFPHVFGENADQPLDRDIVVTKFETLTAEINKATGQDLNPCDVAEGFLKIAVENMANAIKQISTQRGYDVTHYSLCCFGGAGGQHACQVADTLGMTSVYLHPLAGVLSAYGMGLADISCHRQQAFEAPFSEALAASLSFHFEALAADAKQEIIDQGIAMDNINISQQLHLKYAGTDSSLQVSFEGYEGSITAFADSHKQRYGFVAEDKPLVLEAISVAARSVESASQPAHSQQSESVSTQSSTSTLQTSSPQPCDQQQLWCQSQDQSQPQWQQVPIFRRQDMQAGHQVQGPALIIEATGTNVIEPGWRAECTGQLDLVLTRTEPLDRQQAIGTAVDPVMLEVFNNLFMSIAEQMGSTLENTSYSVNVKERLDFSCALFDSHGHLVANAPHMPVHLGSMWQSIRSVMDKHGNSSDDKTRMQRGDVFVLNAPYDGGTHLPDVTVITPVFGANDEVLFYVASRGHHADIGGISPGSMPPDSRTVEQEGILIDNIHLIKQGQFQEQCLRDLLSSGPYPARNPDHNIADLKAQVAANEKGVQELHKMVAQFSLPVVQAYMQHVQDNAEESVRRVLDVLKDGDFIYDTDHNCQIQVSIRIDKAQRSASIDFTGTSPQQANNFNAPEAVCFAAVLYVFRTLVEDDIPMNQGCLKPLHINIPAGSMLAPQYPAAVVAGNVETSQWITDALYGALGRLAASQGTMNNFTFGNNSYQYYETICGGAGAGIDAQGNGFAGASAVQTHMTNSRLTDPEVLEWRYPVMLKDFHIRRGSGGKGQFNGGDGAVRQVQFLEPMTAAILSSHRSVPPFGTAGGEPGQCGENRLIRANGSIEILPATAQVEVERGDILCIATPGGGGYGKP